MCVYVCVTTKKLVFSDQTNSGDQKVAANDASLAATKRLPLIVDAKYQNLVISSNSNSSD